MQPITSPGASVSGRRPATASSAALWLVAVLASLAAMFATAPPGSAQAADTATITNPRCAADPIRDGGRVTYRVTNNSSQTRDYALVAGPHGQFPFRVSPGQTRGRVLQGIPDGTHVARVLHGTTVVAEVRGVVIDYQPNADDAYEITSPACTATRGGRVTFSVTNGSDDRRDYGLFAGTHGHLPFTVEAGQTRSMVLYGIPDGFQTVSIRLDDAIVHRVDDVAFCNAQTAPDAVTIGRPDCSERHLDGNTYALDNALLFTITNNSGRTRSYNLEAGGHAHVGLSLPHTGTAEFLLSGIPNGVHSAAVTSGGVRVGSPVSGLTFDCKAQFEADVRELVNAHRRSVGCPTLRTDARLQRSVELHTTNMYEQDFFAHEGLDGTLPIDRANSEGYSGSFVGENIALGYRSPEAVVQGWLDSDGHRRNIELCTYVDTGISWTNGYWGQVFGKEF